MIVKWQNAKQYVESSVIFEDVQTDSVSTGKQFPENHTIFCIPRNFPRIIFHTSSSATQNHCFYKISKYLQC